MLAHQVAAGETHLRKGHVLTPADIVALQQAGVVAVTVARLEPGDLDEDAAAARLAAAALGPGLRADPAFTGRANLFATQAGLFLPDTARIDAFNRRDPDLTLATLPAFRRVVPGEMVATIKIIPFAVPGQWWKGVGGSTRGDAGCAIPPQTGGLAVAAAARAEGQRDRENPPRYRSAACWPGQHAVFEQRLAHDQAALEAALAGLDPADFDLLIIFGAAAIADRRDVIPAAITATGGQLSILACRLIRATCC